MLPLYVLNSISNPFSLVVIFSYASPPNFLSPPPPPPPYTTRGDVKVVHVQLSPIAASVCINLNNRRL